MREIILSYILVSTAFFVYNEAPIHTRDVRGDACVDCIKYTVQCTIYTVYREHTVYIIVAYVLFI